MQYIFIALVIVLIIAGFWQYYSRINKQRKHRKTKNRSGKNKKKNNR